jgi:ribonuclease-3
VSEASGDTTDLGGIRDLIARLALSDAALPSLQLALTHKSLAQDNHLDSNERLELLGDAALGLAVAEDLLDAFPEKMEGEIARARSLIVRQTSLAAAARRLGLQGLVRLDPAEAATGGRDRDSILSDTFEAVLAVVYRQSGIDGVRSVVREALGPEFETVRGRSDWRDAKSILQEQRQGAHRSAPVYRLAEETGPQHDRRFIVAVDLDGGAVATGSGRTKRDAEQAAAEAALIRLAAESTGLDDPDEAASETAPSSALRRGPG